MKRTRLIANIALGLLISANTFAQTLAPNQKMSVSDRMAKARAAKAEKKATKDVTETTYPTNQSKQTTANYQKPAAKTLKGPNGEEIHIGERGGKYYINKNGQKTYLSSNQ